MSDVHIVLLPLRPFPRSVSNCRPIVIAVTRSTNALLLVCVCASSRFKSNFYRLPNPRNYELHSVCVLFFILILINRIKTSKKPAYVCMCVCVCRVHGKINSIHNVIYFRIALKTTVQRHISECVCCMCFVSFLRHSSEQSRAYDVCCCRSKWAKQERDTVYANLTKWTSELCSFALRSLFDMEKREKYGDHDSKQCVCVCKASALALALAYFSVSYNSWFSFVLFYVFCMASCWFCNQRSYFQRTCVLVVTACCLFFKCIFLSLVVRNVLLFFSLLLRLLQSQTRNTRSAFFPFILFYVELEQYIYSLTHSAMWCDVKWVFAACRMDFTRLNCMIVSQFVCLSVQFNRWACEHNEKQK